MSEYQTIRGLMFPCSERFQKKNIEDALDYMPRDGDTIVASYPKTGTTWLQYTILQIVTKGEGYVSFEDAMYKKAPYMEVTGTAAVVALQSPRFYKHHCPYNMVQKNEKAKTVYIYRNPEDTFVSYYNFMLNRLDHPKPFDEFFEDFLTGDVAYGRYFEHVLSYFAHKLDENLLLVSYEKMHADRRGEILRIAKFLGEDYFQCLSRDSSVLEKVLERTSFDYMKRTLSPNEESSATDDETLAANRNLMRNFFRKGIVGDGKASLSKDQFNRLRKLGLEIIHDTELRNEWFKD